MTCIEIDVGCKARVQIDSGMNSDRSKKMPGVEIKLGGKLWAAIEIEVGGELVGNELEVQLEAQLLPVN